MKSKFEKLIFTKVELWVILLLLMLGVAGLSLYGWYLRHGMKDPNATFFSRVAFNLSELPQTALELYQTGLEFNAAGELVQRNPRRIAFEGEAGFLVEDPNFKEDGYLLLSAYSLEHGISTVTLWDLAKQEKLWEWVPNYDQIVEHTPSLQRFRAAGLDPLGTNSRDSFQAKHPFLLPDGRLLTHAGFKGLLVMLDQQGEVLWTIDDLFHHSIERLPDGNFLVHLVVENPRDRVPPGTNKLTLQEDLYAIVTPDGKILEKTSILDLLERAGQGGLMYGVRPWENDLLHTNDAEPILASDDYVQKGDIAISSRNISTVFLYRPSEDRILWLQTGPWINQHDVDYLGDGVFSIFDNRYIRDKAPAPDAHNSIVYYDMKTGELSRPFDAVFQKEKLYTPEQGLHRILPNGDAFVEITEAHELLRISPEGVRWRYRHPIGPGELGALHWSRYLHRDEIDLSWLPSIPNKEAP